MDASIGSVFNNVNVRGNDSNINIGQGYASRLGTTIDYWVAGYLLLIWLITLYANGTVLMGLGRQRDRLTALDIFLGNLAFSNGLLSLVTYPMTVVSLFVHRWYFGPIGCDLYAFIMLFFGLIAIWTILGIAGVFYRTTMKKYVHRKRQKEQQPTWAFAFIATTYAISGLFSGLPLVGVGDYGPARHGTSCTINWSLHTVSSDTYITCLMLGGFFAPLTAAIFMYASVVKAMANLRLAYINPDFGSHWEVVQKRTLSMSVAVCSCMIISWSPYAIVSMSETYGDPDSLPYQMEAVAAFTAKSSTAFSPLIHLWFTKKFRPLLNRLLCCLCGQESATEELSQSTDVIDARRGTGETRIRSSTNLLSTGRSFSRNIDQIVRQPPQDM